MIENLMFNDYLKAQEIVKEYKNALDKIKLLLNENNIDSLKNNMNVFDTISMDLTTRYLNFYQFIQKYEDSTVKEKLHLELKNFIINKYIQIIVNQDNLIVKQTKEINNIKTQFEKILFKNNKPIETCESTNLSRDQRTSNVSNNNEQINIKKEILQNSNSNMKFILHKETQAKKQIRLTRSVETKRTKTLEIEGNKNLKDSLLKVKKISLIHSDKIYINKSLNNSIVDKSSKTITKILPSPYKISRVQSKDNMVKKDFINKLRNVNRFINVTTLIDPLKKNSSFNNLSNVSNTIYTMNFNNTLTPPGENLSQSACFKNNHSKKFIIRNQKKTNEKKLLNFSNEENKSSIAEEYNQKRNNSIKQKSESREKNTVDYSKKMLQKYYLMLDKFNKNLEEKDILITNKNSPQRNKCKDKKIIYIKENSIASDSKNSCVKKK